jgi:hypothetical protein
MALDRPTTLALACGQGYAGKIPFKKLKRIVSGSSAGYPGLPSRR